MPTVEILNSHTLADLRKEVSISNKALGAIKGYSKGMKKAQIINLMMEHKKRFHHIKMKGKVIREKKEKKAPPKKAPPKKEPPKKAPPKKEDKTYTTPGGIIVDLEKANKSGIKVKKPRSEKQKANDKRLGEASKARAAAAKASK